jgi:tRNA threonylcarbamoyl adenosine modification protein (Sua5/YciO/YrdC/YwlC family)
MQISRLRLPFHSLSLSILSTTAPLLVSFSSFSGMSSQKLIPPTPDGIAYSASLIKDGQLVAFPTETVYGLGANALDAQACTNIFRAKGRPMTDPLIVHVSEPNLASSLVAIEGSTERMFQKLAAEFWPGPLTIIVKAAACIPPEVTANTGFVGIRCPNHPLALTFLTACQLPVAAPSANLFGHVSPTLAQHVIDDLGAKGVQVLDGDSLHSEYTCLHGIESTVVKLDDTVITDAGVDSGGDNSGNTSLHKKQITILRQGAVSQAQIEHVARLQCAGEGDDDGVMWSVMALQRQVKMDAPTPATDTVTDTDAASDVVTDNTINQDVQSEGEVAPGQVSMLPKRSI